MFDVRPAMWYGLILLLCSACLARDTQQVSSSSSAVDVVLDTAIHVGRRSADVCRLDARDSDDCNDGAECVPSDVISFPHGVCGCSQAKLHQLSYQLSVVTNLDSLKGFCSCLASPVMRDMVTQSFSEAEYCNTCPHDTSCPTPAIVDPCNAHPCNSQEVCLSDSQNCNSGNCAMTYSCLKTPRANDALRTVAVGTLGFLDIRTSDFPSQNIARTVTLNALRGLISEVTPSYELNILGVRDRTLSLANGDSIRNVPAITVSYNLATVNVFAAGNIFGVIEKALSDGRFLRRVVNQAQNFNMPSSIFDDVTTVVLQQQRIVSNGGSTLSRTTPAAPSSDGTVDSAAATSSTDKSASSNDADAASGTTESSTDEKSNSEGSNVSHGQIIAVVLAATCVLLALVIAVVVVVRSRRHAATYNTYVEDDDDVLEAIARSYESAA